MLNSVSDMVTHISYKVVVAVSGVGLDAVSASPGVIIAMPHLVTPLSYMVGWVASPENRQQLSDREASLYSTVSVCA
ncbi:hypothetical protein PG993_005748 [Apiospora rasikravindrae]|uniref:Uncharacterized protein n=1 Tax=Apiospora rasikravindrae TaxID=990691 RepID=A0ABR1T9P0_9PEZI